MDRFPQLTKRKWIGGIVAVLLVVAAQRCLSYREVEVVNLAISEDNRVFGAVTFRQFRGTEIHQWTRALSRKERVYRAGLTEPNRGLTCSKNGKMLVYLSISTLVALDTDSGRPRWRSVTVDDPDNSTFFFAGDDQYLALIDEVAPRPYRHRRFGVSKPHFIVIRAEDGFELGRLTRTDVARVLWCGNRFRCVTRGGKFVDMEVGKDGLREIVEPSQDGFDFEAPDCEQHEVVPIPGTRRWRPAPRAENTSRQVRSIRPDRNVVTARLEMSDRQTGAVVGTYNLSISIIEAQMLLTMVAIGGIVWLLLLIGVGSPGPSQSRVAIDYCLVVVMVHLLCTDHSWLWGPRWYAWPSADLVYAVGAAIGLCGLFLAPLAIERTFYHWCAFFIACAFPFLGPTVALSFGLRALRIRLTSPWPLAGIVDDGIAGHLVPERRKLRFGIAEMMLVTAGIAVFIAVGNESLFMLGEGFLIAILIALALLLSTHTAAALGTCLICFAGMVLEGCSVAMGDHEVSQATIFSCMVVFTITFLRIRGLSLRGPELANLSRSDPRLGGLLDGSGLATTDNACRR